MITVSGQNMTEGVPTQANLGADIFIGQEVNGPLTRKAMRHHDKKTFLPVRDHNQCISFDPDVIRVTDKGWIPFHRSGDAEGWKIASPARGLIFVKGVLLETDIKVAVAGWWAINSWGKDNEEGPFRREVMMARTLPVVQTFIDKMHRQDRTVIMEADANNIRWSGHLRGMRQLHPNGLDRAWISMNGDLRMHGKVWNGAVTGVGPDRKHESLNFALVKK